ncbi:MAG: 3,4-dihydroxy-2-butanone 4-phosphate synthase [Candidatus Amesbacteria bacterium GW2011_GWB1_47_26]|uniref:GTP cyclohydrolase-2 n=1 Tax=Candidatus Amesbacteria bacterium GW2011_GWC2_45_19 TaxID=1618366 RepID=A0A0G1M4N2_9BACT|nr:MAG: 3,4-dihydroxy-2-butanone 4-phosphate synthase [Candidatus Amesbacteria bacterium GW2011_GWC2_45_19]KKU38633.1 MAG: 3,4-dihydroxy-2-butanone 4-phosphate synthase [Candidatus Amesbacteria bacterium GW2011_GWA1_46_35]KKU68663.1 MAG: Riboflavin biosynthesis protein RibBA [Microgenomates group bacterium GW2011_GWC1_47_20]KKU74953.1 MAG: 3,4-dihydroxy-2-butanone 4-phosphate synthase [Candidatus Amesbacteria bacterium GW2011_GWB1_47_26]KKU80252.1 MAG: 3,4-dihydroxy-2-butanone 4-phosphate synth
MTDIYLILGAPGSGKTTQGVVLSEHLKLQHISWGKLLRSKRFKKQFPKEYSEIVNERVDNKTKSVLIAGAIEDKLRRFLLKQGGKGIVIDGFPRRTEEADKLIEIVKKYDLKIKAIIKVNTSLESIVSRLRKRLLCRTCGRTYDPDSLYSQSRMCPRDKSTLKSEKIDKELVRKDYQQYLNEITPVFDNLKQSAENYFSVNGDDSEMIVASNMLMKIKSNTREGLPIYRQKSATKLQTKYGEFVLLSFQSQIDYSYHLALIRGEVKGKTRVMVRVHSSCITGDVFSSLRCDCGNQLHKALKRINNENEGVLIYLFQEGRGINIINKINAYRLQDDGFDTIDANEKLGFPAELRNYEAVRDILNDLGIRSIKLITNNPDKINKLIDLGVPVESVEVLEIQPTKHNKKYLETKKRRMGHKLDYV